MAVAVLAPWPAANTQAAAAARTCLTNAIGEPDSAVIERLGPTAGALVQAYAPGAPQPVKNEAVIRAAGWLNEQPRASIRREETGDVSTDFAPSQTGVLLHSGAKSMLYAWRPKRGGVAK